MKKKKVVKKSYKMGGKTKKKLGGAVKKKYKCGGKAKHKMGGRAKKKGCGCGCK